MSDGKRMIAIVDDDESVRRSLKRLLCAAGFEACTFASAEEVLREAELWRISSLILDINLPRASGFELYLSLEARGVHLPTIFITADEKIWDAAADHHLGHMVCLFKPFAASVLLDALNACMVSHSQSTTGDRI